MIVIRPLVGRSKPTKPRISVDLPAPFGPTSAVIEPVGIAWSTFRSASVRLPKRRP
jgi:hypothetical protein